MVKSMMKQNIRRDRKILTIVPIKYFLFLFRVQAFKDKHYQQCRIQDFKWELEGFLVFSHDNMKHFNTTWEIYTSTQQN